MYSCCCCVLGRGNWRLLCCCKVRVCSLCVVAYPHKLLCAFAVEFCNMVFCCFGGVFSGGNRCARLESAVSFEYRRLLSTCRRCRRVVSIAPNGCAHQKDVKSAKRVCNGESRVGEQRGRAFVFFLCVLAAVIFFVFFFCFWLVSACLLLCPFHSLYTWYCAGFRALRPIRLVSRFSSTKIVVSTLLCPACLVFMFRSGLFVFVFVCSGNLLVIHLCDERADFHAVPVSGLRHHRRATLSGFCCSFACWCLLVSVICIELLMPVMCFLFGVWLSHHGGS